MTHQDNRILQELLAQRLYEIDPQGKGSSDIRPWSSVGYVTQQRYGLLAAECLRQMEWNARKHQTYDAVMDGATLAPPDWKG
jgi:hypothetical protein